MTTDPGWMWFWASTLAKYGVTGNWIIQGQTCVRVGHDPETWPRKAPDNDNEVGIPTSRP